MLEAFDRIEPIGLRPIARCLAFIAASLASFFGVKEVTPATWWPEDEPQEQPVTSKQAINLMRSKLGG